jgi:hypothetical protein
MLVPHIRRMRIAQECFYIKLNGLSLHPVFQKEKKILSVLSYEFYCIICNSNILVLLLIFFIISEECYNEFICLVHLSVSDFSTVESSTAYNHFLL